MRAEDLLPEDTDQARFGSTTVRKGTVGAFLLNARIWADPTRPEPDRAEAERDMRDAVPRLRAIGLFEVFEPRDERLRAFVADVERGGTGDQPPTEM